MLSVLSPQPLWRYIYKDIFGEDDFNITVIGLLSFMFQINQYRHKISTSRSRFQLFRKLFLYIINLKISNEDFKISN